MSVLGQKQTCAAHKPVSALPPKADMCSATWDVRFVPIADIRCPLSTCVSCRTDTCSPSDLSFTFVGLQVCQASVR